MSLSYLWPALAIMSALTILLRLLPLATQRFLGNNRAIDALNRTLPLAIMVILTLASLKGGGNEPMRLGAELLALGLVALSYLRWRNTLLSVVLGVAALNGVLWMAA
ncbi:MAG: AzlD domain-containing protein [Corticimicrobacter sp.]|uniref:AzlD domain-containing protein n=1 Tax=Corticimicrobacter populi TaxID=2175229 RepID=A0A2V1JUM4_9BURK|nr:AzlD domain-containing protein [Corticimicrobacter populi]PWF21576.1 AzlD domain-containing protein [Corticimicrobacter populi]